MTARKVEPETVLAEADRIIHGERRVDYGSAVESFERIANLWTPILEVEITADQVALCLVQLKVARYLVGKQRDSVVDMAGYTGLLSQINGWEDE